jgi:hypothetical protein
MLGGIIWYIALDILGLSWAQDAVNCSRPLMKNCSLCREWQTNIDTAQTILNDMLTDDEVDIIVGVYKQCGSHTLILANALELSP